MDAEPEEAVARCCFIGDDRAEAHHDIELVDEDGRRLGRRRLREGIDGLVALHALVADHLENDADGRIRGFASR